jgi:tight adherence protein B
VLRRDSLTDIPLLDRVLFRFPYAAGLQRYMQQADMNTPPATLLFISGSLWLAVVFLGLLMNRWLPGVLLLAFGAAAVPFVVVAVKRHRRFRKFEEGFPEAIDMLARAVRAGHAFTTGFSLIGNEMPEPVAGEFRTAFQQQNLGMSLPETLRSMAERMPLPDVRIFVAALLIQRESGGNLAEVLDNLSQVIRERFKLLRDVNTKTAEGKLSMYILTGMPLVAGAAMYMMNPEYMSRLFTDPMGHAAIGIAVTLQVLGYLVIRRIVQIKV